MIHNKFFPVVAAILACSCFLAFPARAEWFADVSIGTALTSSSDLTTISPGTSTIATDVGFDSSFTLGGRMGHWSRTKYAPGLQLGGAAGLFRFSPDITSQVVPVNGTPTLLDTTEIDVTALSFDLMARYPMMVSRKYPKGRLRPYLTLGPAIFFSTIKDQGNIAGVGCCRSATDTSFGLKLGFGAAWQIRKAVDLFGEYRFTHFNAEADITDAAGTLTTAHVDINTNHLVAGISFRF